ncbi:substrate-binding domain-containing protein [Ideonella azotifigens]|uniref:Substrate-binding domain-containing protein n=1 Tax=Ideonella azotifigens TaxID=513160 RepID=A0ABN1JR52_9BURK|nr:substrate-binding domain-containing protein [Ideonella azotifigens]MCD2340252.1 substrate-binding domain-containing protein [Ideonella azotifigens]
MNPRAVIAFLVAAAACASAAHAAELKILSAGAFKPVLLALKPGFEQQTGHTLKIENDTAGALQKRVLADEAFDLLFSSPASMQPLQAAGKLASEQPTPVARVAIGVAVPRGAPLPDIGTVEAFRQLLLSARHVAYIDPASGGSSGIYLDQLFQRLAVAPQVRAKAVLVNGGLVAARLVDGSADVAIHQISEILAVPEAVLVGPLPAEIQNYTVYAAALPPAAAASAAHSEAVRALLAALQSPGTDAILAAKGMERAP